MWRNPPGLFGWLSVTTHQAIGKRYIVTAFMFLLLGGMEALLMRIQLARPGQHLSRTRPVQPDLHHARHHDDVSVRRAGDGRNGRFIWFR